MSVNVNDTSNRFYKLYLYAGPSSTAKSAAKNTSATAPSAPAESSAVVVQISDAAKVASAALSDAQSQPGGSVKAKVDALYAEVKARGSSVTFDISKPGELLDVSSLTDDDLGKIAVDKGGEFSNDLQEYARGALNARVKVSLEPYENSVFNGDRRGHTMTINLLYEQMSEDAKAALNWTPAMMVSNNSMLEGDTKLFGKFSMDTVLANLVNATQKGGISFSLANAKWTQSA